MANFGIDSPVEGAVRSEPVSEISPFRATLGGNKLILALKIASKAPDRLDGGRLLSLCNKGVFTL